MWNFDACFKDKGGNRSDDDDKKFGEVQTFWNI